MSAIAAIILICCPSLSPELREQETDSEVESAWCRIEIPSVQRALSALSDSSLIGISSEPTGRTEGEEPQYRSSLEAWEHHLALLIGGEWANPSLDLASFLSSIESAELLFVFEDVGLQFELVLHLCDRSLWKVDFLTLLSDRLGADYRVSTTSDPQGWRSHWTDEEAEQVTCRWSLEGNRFRGQFGQIPHPWPGQARTDGVMGISVSRGFWERAIEASAQDRDIERMGLRTWGFLSKVFAMREPWIHAQWEVGHHTLLETWSWSKEPFAPQDVAPAPREDLSEVSPSAMLFGHAPAERWIHAFPGFFDHLGPMIESLDLAQSVPFALLEPRDSEYDPNLEWVMRWPLSGAEPRQAEMAKVDTSSLGLQFTNLSYGDHEFLAWIVPNGQEGLLPAGKFVTDPQSEQDEFWIASSPWALSEALKGPWNHSSVWRYDSQRLWSWFQTTLRPRIESSWHSSEELQSALEDRDSVPPALRWVGERLARARFPRVASSEPSPMAGIGAFHSGGVHFQSVLGSPLSAWLIPTLFMWGAEEIEHFSEAQRHLFQTRECWERLQDLYKSLESFVESHRRWPKDLNEWLNASPHELREALVDPRDRSPSMLLVDESPHAELIPISYRYLSAFERRHLRRPIVLFSTSGEGGRLVLFEDGRVGLLSDSQLRRALTPTR